LNLLIAGKLDFAVVKSDVAIALNQTGLSDRARARIDQVQVVAKLHDMPMSIIGHANGPEELTRALLESSRINIGLEGSGERIAAEELLKAMRIDDSELRTTRFNSNEVVEAFCEGETDIVLELIAHPARIYDRLINECDGKFLHVNEVTIKELSALNPYVFPTVIYGAFYTRSPLTYSTYAVSALLVANADIKPELRTFVSTRLEATIEEMQDLLPEWINMTQQDFQLDQPPRFIWQ
jgi:TRAP-type uncharacterized transport system substrate-binding protein